MSTIDRAIAAASQNPTPANYARAFAEIANQTYTRREQEALNPSRDAYEAHLDRVRNAHIFSE